MLFSLEKSSADALAALLSLTSTHTAVRRRGRRGEQREIKVNIKQEENKEGKDGDDNEDESDSDDDAPSFSSPSSRSSVVILPTSELVVGDIVELKAGDIVPADMRLFYAVDVRVNESALTGESAEVSKHSLPLPPPTLQHPHPHLTPDNMLFSSTNMCAGKAHGIVIATGIHTKIGGIASLLQGTSSRSSPSLQVAGSEHSHHQHHHQQHSTNTDRTGLQKMIDRIGMRMSIAAVTACIILFIIGVTRGYDDPAHSTPGWLQLLLIAATLAVSAIPEGLPLAVTICFAMGSVRLAAAKTLVRQLPSVENLGSVSTICSDKTGTMTQGKMTCVQMYGQGRTVHITGKGYTRDGSFLYSGKPLDRCLFNEYIYVPLTLILGGYLCNECEVKYTQQQNDNDIPVQATVKGSSTEAPLVIAADKYGLSRMECSLYFPKLDDIPFNSARKLMATLHANLYVPTTRFPPILISVPPPSTLVRSTSLKRTTPSPHIELEIQEPTFHQETARQEQKSTMIHIAPSEVELPPLSLPSQSSSAARAPVAPSSMHASSRGEEEEEEEKEENKRSTDALNGLHAILGRSVRFFSVLKGAPNVLLSMCDRYINEWGQVVEINAIQRQIITQAVDSFSSQALRVLCVAFKPFDSLPYFLPAPLSRLPHLLPTQQHKIQQIRSWRGPGENSSEDEESGLDASSATVHDDIFLKAPHSHTSSPHLSIHEKLDILGQNCIFAGLMACIDPEREGIKEAIETSTSAGIKTVMITGKY